MPIYTLTNIPSMRAQRYLGIAQRVLNITLERLSSGKRINRAQDDAAGLLLVTRFTKSIQAWETGGNNLRMGLDLLSTADSFTSIILEDLHRLNELANQANNGLLSDDERELLNMEFREIVPEIQRLALNTRFLGKTLLTGSLAVNVQAGEGASNVVSVVIRWMSGGAGSGGLTIGGNGLNISALSIGTASEALSTLQSLSLYAFPRITNFMANIGAQAAAFTKSVDATDALVENLISSRGRIENADLAKETTNLTNYQIVVQSGISALVQANAAQTLALALLGGGA
ncbi:MAG: hypothetical protein NC904_06100 [Candidatus Omnitrophica bacterium]|nr:hypothetical protein [Candidatus Omnitrophota bacterium]